MACLTCCNLFAFSTLIIQSEPHNHYVSHCRAIIVNSPFVSKYFSEHFVCYSYNLYCNNVFSHIQQPLKVINILTASQTCGQYIYIVKTFPMHLNLWCSQVTPSFWTFTNTLPRQSSWCAFFKERLQWSWFATATPFKNSLVRKTITSAVG